MSLDQLEIFFGDANNAEARIYARLPRDAAPAVAKLAGRVVGPQCAYASTLSATIRMNPKRPQIEADTDLLAEAIVPDPCFWSPELPFLYRVEVELRQGAELLASAAHALGIRPLGARGRKLMLEGKPWVVRGVEQSALPPAELSQWRAADTAMVVEAPSDELCAKASRLGAWLLARIDGDAIHLAAELHRLARWPCVAMILLEAGAELPEAVVRRPRNVLLAQHFGPGVAVSPAAWAEAIVCEAADPSLIASRSAGASLPIIAQQAGQWHDDLSAARRACDDLQRALAGHGEFAGYLV
jgi:hypothetical protein